ncbi:uncharacterized protein [Apostichopus japonicus]|uniref:uncharacterized protein n=1 Tax=Stichopus japonicus TaxID=307972 RepID=UPI003AB1AD73
MKTQTVLDRGEQDLLYDPTVSSFFWYPTLLDAQSSIGMVNWNYSVLRSAFLVIYHIRITALGRNVYSLHEQGKCGLISLEIIFRGHMMRILHRMVYNMLMVMYRQRETDR